jgi:tetratricopeptide (TPR) repeat protein
VLVKQLSRLTIAATVLLLICAVAWGQDQEQQASPWKDRAEYDLYNSIVQEQDASKKLQLLDSYMEKYPETNFEPQVRLMYAQTYQALNDNDKLYAAAQKLVELDENSLQGHMLITDLTMRLGSTEAAHLANGEKSAKALINILSGMQKPENVSADQWDTQKKALLLTARKTLGWIAMNRKDNVEAETEFKEALGIEPRDGQVSYWLGTVILAQRNPDKQSAAFFHFARAANLTGEGAMENEARQKVGEYLDKIYTSFHGDDSGLDEITQLAMAQPLPPANMPVVKSKQVLEAEREEQLRRENPKLYLWMNVKQQLTAPGGEEYFNTQVRNSAMPSLRGYLIAQSPQDRPDTLVLGIESRGTREVTLKLNEAFRYSARSGTVINFECVPRSFSQNPFNVGFDCDQAKVSGWPPPPARQTTR